MRRAQQLLALPLLVTACVALTAATGPLQAAVSTSPPGLPAKIGKTALPHAFLHMPYTARLNDIAKVHGFTVKDWATTGSLPPGLSLSAGGVISGVPVDLGSSTFTIVALGPGGQSVSAQFSIRVVLAPAPRAGSRPSIVTTSLPKGVANASYVFKLIGVGVAGWAVTAGALPDGITLSKSGVFTGKPDNVAETTFTITAYGSGAVAPVRAKYTLDVVPLLLDGPQAQAATRGVGYAYHLAADGGVGALTFSISSGALPDGLSLNTSTGLISGTPTFHGDFPSNPDFTFTATVEDSRPGAPDTSSQTLSIPVSDNWAVSVGDSFISGEGGRWAGNTNQDTAPIDALGPGAYWDATRRELIPGCHRSHSAEIHIAVLDGENLACSGATTTTDRDDDGFFKPGLDFYTDKQGREGQATLLRDFAHYQHVSLIALSIGGNDFKFGDAVTACVEDYLATNNLTTSVIGKIPNWIVGTCSDDESIGDAANVQKVTAGIEAALLNIHKAMSDDDYPDSSYTILVQDYPAPIPTSSELRYGEDGTDRIANGCPLRNDDTDWSILTALPTIDNSVRAAVEDTGLQNIKFMDISQLFDGHRLCEKGVDVIEKTGFKSWYQAGAVDKLEWVNQIRPSTMLPGYDGPYSEKESIHPNYFGQLALRDCLRQAWNNGNPTGGTCTGSGPGLNSYGEPLTTLRTGPAAVPKIVKTHPHHPTTTTTTTTTTTGSTLAVAWDEDAEDYEGQVGKTVSYSCPAGGSASDVWGSGPFTDDSSVCTAAVFSGLITFAKGGMVTFTMGGKAASFAGSSKNGVKTQSYGSWPSTFTFVTG